MIKQYKERALKRRALAMRLLFISILVIITGIVMVIWQLHDMAKFNGQGSIFDISSRMIFILLVMFIAQMLIKLYKYNMLKADYFLACSDALKLSTELDAEAQQRFGALLQTLCSDQNPLDTPDTPGIPFLNKPT